MTRELFPLGGTRRVSDVGKAEAPSEAPVLDISPCPGFPPQRCLGSEHKIPTSFSCHLLFRFQDSPLAQGLSLEAGGGCWADCSRLSLPPAPSDSQKLPPRRLLSLSGFSAPLLLPSFWSCLSSSTFYLRIPKLFVQFPSC